MAVPSSSNSIREAALLWCSSPVDLVIVDVLPRCVEKPRLSFSRKLALPSLTDAVTESLKLGLVLFQNTIDQSRGWQRPSGLV